MSFVEFTDYYSNAPILINLNQIIEIGPGHPRREKPDNPATYFVLALVSANPETPHLETAWVAEHYETVREKILTWQKTWN